MVKPKEQSLNQAFVALADPLRRKVLLSLTKKPQTISQLSHPFEISAPAMTKHIRMLEKANLVQRQKAGTAFVISIQKSPMLHIGKWLSNFVDV